jgi:tetratricopeptide (TPR) repeat protein
MHRIFQFSLLVLLFTVFGCAPTSVEKLVTKQGGVLQLNDARFDIPAGSVPDSTLVRIAKKGVGKRAYDHGFFQLGESYVIEPETLVFQNPIHFSYAAKDRNLCLGAKIGQGFVPLANSEMIGDTLKAQLWHGGEYFLIRKPDRYGIIGHTNTKEGLLIVSDIYVGDYLKNFKRALKAKGYNFPVWTYVYKYRESIEANARLLHEELKKLHNEYGDFRLDVVSFGIGGLVTHRYLTDSAYYQRDISSAVVAIGTPFFGSSFADLENVKRGKTPFRFFILDGMGNNALSLMTGSEFISMIQDKKHLPGYHYYDDPMENKNFVSLHGQIMADGILPEEISGDGLVSVRSAMLTPIEPAVFELTHLDLLESSIVHKVAADFVLLYRSFNWPMLFSSVWSGKESSSSINEKWEREVRLHFRDDADFDALLEFNKNMLASAPANAVLITNGDYDTYPAWHLQERGLRQDVLIVNRSLLNLKDYARFLQRHGLPLAISEQDLDQIKHKKADDKLLTISDQLIQRLLKQTSRPVVFSTTVYEPAQYGYPLMLSGLVYEISESDIDVTRTKQLLYEVFEFRKLLSRPLGSFDVNIQNMAKNYAAIAFSLSSALDEQDEYEEAIKAIEFAKRFSEEPLFCCSEAQIYFKMNKKSEADAALERALEMKNGDLKMRKEVAQIYFDNGMREKAIKVLAASLVYDPEDREIPALINKYQEE